MAVYQLGGYGHGVTLYVLKRELNLCGRAPCGGLIVNGNIVDKFPSLGTNNIFPLAELHIPMESLGWIVVGIALTTALRLAVDKQFYLGQLL